MKPLLVRSTRVPSLLLAAVLQLLPMARVALPAAPATTNMIAIMIRWCAGGALALGSVHAVSGASAHITSPLRVQATNGVPFSMRLTTAPDQAHYWTGSNVPPGLAISGSGAVWTLAGTPSVGGTYTMRLTAKDQINSGASRTVSATMVMVIVDTGNQPPMITRQPASTNVTAGQNAAFSVTASGTAPLAYQWRFAGAALPNETNATLHLNNVTEVKAGNYTVVITNIAGSVTSAVATLGISPPVAPTPTIPGGAYSGLFFDSNHIAQAASGFFTASVRTNGDFKAVLQTGRRKTAFAGKFTGDGHATNTVARAGSTPVVVELHIDMIGAHEITGRVSEATWTSDLLAKVNGTTAGARAGQYTMIIPGADDGALAPSGDGAVSLKIASAGSAILSGTLADGTRVLQRVVMSATGELPVYVPAYAGNGSLFGWLRVRPSGAVDLDGELNWVRPPAPAPKFYTGGFTLASSVVGSAYSPLAGGTWFNANAARVILTGGNLVAPSTNNVTLTAIGKVAGAGPDKLKLAVAPATGLFKGTVTPAGSKPIKIQGAVLPRQSFGSGYFFGANEVGNVYFGP